MRNFIFVLWYFSLGIRLNGLITADIHVQKECREICEKTRSKKLSKFAPVYPIHYSECIKECHHKISSENKEDKSGKDVIILGADDKLPSDLHMPEHIPKISKEILKKLGYPITQKTECDDSPVSKNSEEIPASPTDIKVQCERRKGSQDLVIKWNQPKEGLQYLQGYQVLYSFLSNSGYVMNTHNCKVVGKNTTTFTINKSLGLRSGNVALTVVSVPLRKKFSATLYQFEGCNDVLPPVVARMKRSAQAVQPTATPVSNTNRVVILPKGATLPTGLTIPSNIPKSPFGRNIDSNCKNVELNETTVPVNVVTNLRVECEKHQKSRTIVVQWVTPSNVVGKVEGFQVHYSFTTRDSYDVGRCIEVPKERRGASFDINLTRDDAVLELNVATLPLYSKQQMKMKRFTPCVDEKTKEEPTTKLGGIVGGITAGLALVAILGVVMHYVRINQMRRGGNAARPTGPMTFFSHCFETTKEIHKLLSFAARLQGKYGVPCRIDLLEQRVMETMTEAVWRNTMYTNSRKIVIVITKKYLEIFQGYIDDPSKDWSENLLQVRVINDMIFVQNHLMTNGYSNKIICLLTEGVKRMDLPGFLQTRAIFNWPTPDSDGEREFVRSLLDVETRSLVT